MRVAPLSFVLLAAAVSSAVGPLAAAAAPIDVALTVTNRESAARTAEPVTSGVPFAQGVIRDVGALRLLRGGVEVPAQFLATARWPDGSVRWVLLDFQVDLPASGSTALTLQTGTTPQAVSGISVTDATDSLTINTQARIFTFAKSEFVVRGHSFKVQSGGTTYTAVPTTWAIEEQGPMKVVVRVDGVWRAGGAALVNDLNRFRARMVFFRGRTDLRVSLVFRNGNSFGWDTASGGQPQQPDVVLSGVSFDSLAGPLALLQAGGSYHFGSGVEKTWNTEIADDGLATLRTTRFAANGTLVSGDAPPRPLAAAAASYYASTKAWGAIALPVTGAATDRQADFDRFELMQRAKVDSSVVENPPGLTGITLWGHLSQDFSSWNDYGDLRWGGDCGTFSSNHYDWPYGMYLQFMRTGRLAFADAARVMAAHEIDFDIYHSGADSPAFNYQKNWECRPSHDSPFNTFGGGRPSHTWSQGYALQWLLTGDRRGKDAFDEIQDGVRQYIYESFNAEGYIDTSEIRIQGWLVENLVNLWRINPDATLPTTSYGAKTIPAAIKNVLQNVIDRETAAGQQGFVISEGDPGGYLRQTLVHAYFLEPAIKAYDEVLAGSDAAYAATLLALIRRMTNWLVGTTIGGDTNGAGLYRPRQIPYWVDTRLSQQSDGQLPYLLMAANAAGFLYSNTGDTAWRDSARALFQDYVRYVGAISPNVYGDPSLRTPASYNSNIFTNTESKIHGWSNRYGQYFLAAEGGGTPPAPGTLQMSAAPVALRFGAASNGTSNPLWVVTPAQNVLVTATGTGTLAWTASADQAWIQVVNGSGTGAGQFTVSMANPGNVIAGRTSLTGSITLTAPAAANSPVSIPVTLTIDYGSGTTVGPFGQIDTPAQNAAGVVGAIGVTGWALDDVGVQEVRIYRNCLPFENQANCQLILGNNVAFIGTAAFLAGARPDVEAAFSSYPQPYRAGWGYLLLTNMLPHVTNQQAYGGQGALTLYALAIDVDDTGGHGTWLGRTLVDHTPTSIAMANDTIAKPFGAIDTPGQGQTVGGMLANFGWALTPDSNTAGGEAGDILVPTNGSTMVVFIDGLSTALVNYNQCRGNVGNPVGATVYCNDDVANIFGNPTPKPTFTARESNPTKYRNLDNGRAAIGAYDIDTRLLANGLHTIAWSVTDSAGRNEGIGSRFFTVLNAGADAGRDLGSKAPGPGGTPYVFRRSPGSSEPRPGAAIVGIASPLPLFVGSVLPAVLQEAILQQNAPALPRGDARMVTALPPADARVWARTGFDLQAPYDQILPDDDGVRRAEIAALGRLELSLGRVDTGYLVANGTLRDLPPGSAIDPATGIFTWMPGPGYFGTYRLVFIRGGEQIAVDVTIRP